MSLSGAVKSLTGGLLGGGSDGGALAAPAVAADPMVADKDAMAEAEMRKQKTGQRAAGAGATRSASSVDMLGFTAPSGRREASRQLLG